MKSRCFLIFLLFFEINAAIAQVKISKENLHTKAEIGQESIASLQSCSDAFGSPYTNIAVERDSQFLRLIDAAGYDVDAFIPLHYQKIAIIKSLYVKDEMTVNRCDLFMKMAKRDISSIDKLLSIDKSKSKRSAAITGNACNQAADVYQARFQVTGKISDLTCFQTAARRELDAGVR